MSKIDEYNKAKKFLMDVKDAFRIPKIQFEFVPNQPDLLLEVYNVPIFMDKLLRRALNGLSHEIATAAIQLAKADLEKARLEAIEEAQEILNLTEKQPQL